MRSSPKSKKWTTLVLCALFGAGLVETVDSETTPRPVGTTFVQAQVAPSACKLCSNDPGVPVEVFDAEKVRVIARAYSDSNVTRLARLDSLFEAGTWGPPRSSATKRKAHLLARLLTLNAYSYMIRFSTDSTRVYEAGEEALAPAFETFSDPGVVPIARLSRARMGLGQMCARYDLSKKMETETMLGGKRFRVRIDDVTIEGEQRRVLILDFPTSLFDVIEVWIAEHVCIDVEHLRMPGPPAPYEAYVLEHLRGLWVNKFGLHRPEAFVFWVTPRDPLRTSVPDQPLVGVRIYVPHLRLELPSVLPDIGFEDLREVDLPQPVLLLRYIREHRYPSWLEPAKLRGFKNWEGTGPLPPDLRLRFPDL